MFLSRVRRIGREWRPEHQVGLIAWEIPHWRVSVSHRIDDRINNKLRVLTGSEPNFDHKTTNLKELLKSFIIIDFVVVLFSQCTGIEFKSCSFLTADDDWGSGEMRK
jgi:hypothetical protein